MHGVLSAISTPMRVIVGPVDAAVRYVNRHRLTPGDYAIVSNAQELHRIDPPDIERIVLCGVRQLGADIAREVRDEVHQIRALWPVRLEKVTG